LRLIFRDPELEQGTGLGFPQPGSMIAGNSLRPEMAGKI
jgi:hypothetical protein